jgi:outer membrane protein TolC
LKHASYESIRRRSAAGGRASGGPKILSGREDSVRKHVFSGREEGVSMIQHYSGLLSGAVPPAGLRRRKTAPPPAVFLFLWTLCGPALLFSQEAGTASPAPAAGTVLRLTPDEAVERAIKNNLSLESARIELDTKKRASNLVWNQFLPDLNAQGGLSRSNDVSVTMGQASLRWHALGEFSASLALTSALFAGIKTIRQDYRTGLVTLEKARVQLERNIRKAYNDMLLLGESIKVQQDSLAAAERQVAIAQANYNSGLAPELTLLQARVNRDNLKPDIEENVNLYKTAMAQFAVNLGLPYDAQFELVSPGGDINFVDLDVADLVSKSVSGKIDILELQQKILYLKNARTAQALQLWTPNLVFSWNYSRTLSNPWENGWGDRDNWQNGGSFSIGLQWKLNNLFPFTKEGQGLKDADNGIRAANIGLAQAIQGTELEVYNTVLGLEKTQASIEARGQTVELARRSYDSTEEAYRAGLQDFNSVQNAEEALRQARQGVVQQQFNYLNGLIDLEYAIGVPFGTLSGTRQKGE